MPEKRPEYGAQAELARVTTNLRTNREAANVEAREAITKAVSALVAALDGERLLAAPNLATSNEPVYGYRIRCKDADKPLGWRGRETLVLNARGGLDRARSRHGGPGWLQALAGAQGRGGL